jgi:hypothetical protein
MALKGDAILAVWNEVDPASENDFDEWYFREHVPERTSVPGILRGRRYRADHGTPRSMAFYEAASMAVLTRGAYRTQLANPTEWTRRVMARFRLARRGLCDVAGSVGEGIGGAAAVVHVAPGDPARLRPWILGILLHELHAMPLVAHAHLWTLAPGEPPSATADLNPPGAQDAPIAWVIVVETMEMAAAEAVTEAILGRNPVAHGAASVRPYPSYRLLYALDGK